MRTIRRCVFETNSSLSHSCVIMTEEQDKKWEEENLYYYPNSFYNPFNDLPEDKRPKSGCLYTQDEVIGFYELQNYVYDPNDYSDEEDPKEEFIKEMGDFIGYNQWVDDEDSYHDTETYTTPRGEKIIVHCKYGSDY